jgi:hypothetical protein
METRTAMSNSDHQGQQAASPAMSRPRTAVTPRVAPATSTMPKRNIFAATTVEDEKAAKLPDQAKMAKHIQNLNSGLLPQVMEYFVKNRGIKEETVKAYKVGGCVLRIKDEADPTKTVDHPSISFPWIDTRGDQEVVTRIKTRSIKDKTIQRLDPPGSFFFFKARLNHGNG